MPPPTPRLNGQALASRCLEHSRCLAAARSLSRSARPAVLVSLSENNITSVDTSVSNPSITARPAVLVSPSENITQLYSQVSNTSLTST